MKKIISTYFCICLTLATGMTQSKLSTDKLETLIEAAMDKAPELPSLSIAVVQGDKVLYTNAFGMADPGKNIKATPTSSYYIASCTKSFVGLLAAVLESEGKIKLDVPLTEYKPFNQFKDPSMFENVTIRDLLTHQSGLSNGMLTTRHAYLGDYTQEDNLYLLEEKTTTRKEGKTYQYDNLGYNILDVLLRAEFGERWQNLLDEKILTPLGMDHTSAYISEATKKDWGLAWPYICCMPNNQDSRVYIMKNDGMMQAAGGMITCAEDAAQWLLFNINKGKLGGKQIYPESMLSSAHTAIVEVEDNSRIFTQDGYGLGWVTGKYQDERVIYHFGGFSGFFSHISFLPDQKVGLAIFVNEPIIGRQIANIITDYVYQTLMGKEIEVESEIANIEPSIKQFKERIQASFDKRAKRTWQLSEPLENYTGTYVSRELGTLKVSIKKDKPYVELSNLHCIATPFPKKNTMRVEFVPLSGEVIQFKLDKNGKAKEVIVDGALFTREGS